MGLYQNIERFGVRIGDVLRIAAIKDGIYLYFDADMTIGGWPWNEFTLVEMESGSGRED